MAEAQCKTFNIVSWQVDGSAATLQFFYLFIIGFFNWSRTFGWRLPTARKVGRGWWGVWDIASSPAWSLGGFVCKSSPLLLQGTQECSWEEVPGFAVPAAHTLSKDCVGREAEWRLGADSSPWRVKALLDRLFSNVSSANILGLVG